MLAVRVMDPCVAQTYFVCVCDAAGASVFGGTSAVRRLPYVFSGTRAAGWAFCLLCTPMLGCLRGTRL